MSAVHLRMQVGDERYAMPIGNVLEVAELGALSRVPGSGAAMLGVRNLNGSVLPVFELARVLGITGSAPTPRVVVAEYQGCRVGLAVNAVTDVASLATDAEEAGEGHLTGAVLEDGRLVGIFDVERLFGVLAGAVA